MNKKLACFGLVSALLSMFLTAAPTFAEHKPGTLYLSPMIGGYVFEGNQDQEDALAFGLTLGFNYTENWSTEFTVNYAGTEDEGNSRGDIDVGIFRWDVLYHFFPKSPVVPYLAAGLGGLYSNPEEGSSDLDFMADWGGGLKYYITENVALRADVRHIYEVDDDFHNLLFSGGLVIQLGSKKPPSPLKANKDRRIVIVRVMDSQRPWKGHPAPGWRQLSPADGFMRPLDLTGEGINRQDENIHFSLCPSHLLQER